MGKGTLKNKNRISGGCGCKSKLMGGYIDKLKQKGGTLGYGFDLGDSIGGHPAVVGVDGCTAPKILGKSFTGGFTASKTRKTRHMNQKSPKAKHARKRKTRSHRNLHSGGYSTENMMLRTFDGKQPDWNPTDI